MRVDDFSPRLLGILEVAAQAAAQELAAVGERHLLHGFLTVGGGLTSAILSLLQVDFPEMAAWLETQNPFDEKGGLKTEHLSAAVEQLCQEALIEAQSLCHASVKVAHLLLASTASIDGFAAALWRGRIADPWQVGEAIRRGLGEEEIVLDAELKLNRRHLSPGLQRLLGLAWQARTEEEAPTVTVRHLFRACGRLETSDLAPIPGKLRALLRQVGALLFPHPLFAPDGFLAEERLDDSGQGALALAQQAVEEDGQALVTSPQLVAALLALPDGHGQTALLELKVEDPVGLAQAMRQRFSHWDPDGETECPPWQFNFSSHCLKILRLAANEADREGVSRVSDRHLLMGVLRDGQGPAIDFLFIEKGVRLARMRAILWGSGSAEEDEDDLEGPLWDDRGRLNLARLDQAARYILHRSVRESQAVGDPLTSTPYLFIAMTKVEHGVTQQALLAQDKDPRRVRHGIRDFMRRQEKPLPSDTARTTFSKRALDILERADKLARQEHARSGERHLLLAFLAGGGGQTGDLLRGMGIDLAMIETQLVEAKGETLSVALTPLLNRWGRDLTRLARAEQLDPVIGRESELSQVIEILGQRDVPNPLLVGEAGVGKTAIVEGIAQRIVAGQVPASLQGRRLVELSVNALVKGCVLRGQFEERLDRILQEARAAGAILFFDEAHTLVGAGAAGHGRLDAANILKPALARGELHCIGATTLAEYRQSIERDAALARRFQLIRVEEPSAKETLDILRQTRHLLENHHQVRILDEAIGAVVKLSDTYMSEQHRPARARRLVDQACAWVGSRSVQESGESPERDNWPELDAEAIAQVVARETGIPLTTLTAAEVERLQQLEVELQRHIIGQDQAIKAVVRVIKQGRVGMKNPRHPLGVFLFVGPTGVGKTALARALATCLFGVEDPLIRLDMSEYAEPHTVSKLVGAPPGYRGYGEEGQLSGPLRHRPYSVVLLDEFEKAHPDVWNLFLQLFDEGRLADAAGRQVNARNAAFILTSNVGTDLLRQRRIGFQAAEDEYEHAQEAIRQELKSVFRPEFLNRIDDVIVFNRLSRGNIRAIVRLQLEELEKPAAEHSIRLHWEDAAIGLLAEQGYSEEYGVRHLARTIEKLVKEPLTDLILTGVKGTCVARRSVEGTITLDPDVGENGNSNPIEGSDGAHPM